MRNFKDLIEASGDVGVFTLGRFNPPTTGHEKLITKLNSVAKQNSASMYVFPTHSNDPAKNPLPHGLKVAYMKKMYKKYAKNIQISKARNVFEVAKVLYDKGHKSIIMVVGSDRVAEFTNLLKKYDGVKSTHGFYEFESIQVVSAGERDPDAEGVSGMSASKMRAAAADGDKDSFLQGVPSSFKDGDKLYRDVRKNMGILEERDMGDMSDFEQIRDAYLTGKIWNVGDIVESNDIRGEVIRKGTNYLSFVSEDGKVHKAWLHNIILEDITKKDLDQVEKFADRLFAKVGIDVEFTRHFMDRVNDARNKKPINTSELTRLFKQSYAKYGKKIAQLGPDAEAVINDMKTDVNMPFVLNLKGNELELVAKTVMRKKDFKTSGPKLSFEEVSIDEARMSALDKLKKFDKSRVASGKPAIFKDKKGQKFVRMSKQGQRTIMNVPADEIDDFEKKGYKIIEGTELDERNYAKEYANYQGTPEQIARRSSRNKARRVMGDKTKIGMDVGHKDNDPLNNDPKNLRNEDPSVNRREPRLREKDDLDEMAWYNKLKAKIDQMTHPTDYEVMVKDYLDRMMKGKGKPKRAGGVIVTNQPSGVAAAVAKEYGHSGRALGLYINKLVDKGVIPKELKAEKIKEVFSFKDFVDQINEVKQDKDIDDKKGTQPAKYYAGDMAKSTKDKRDAHFKKKKSGPAPGDSAETKPSVHTKKFKQMFGEVLPDNADQGEYIDDFINSDAPQFKGKSKEKRKEMAIAAYLSKNESALDGILETLSEDGHTDVASMKNKVKIAMSALQKMQGELSKLGDEDSLPTWWTNKVSTAVSRIDDMSDYLDTQVESYQLDEKITGLVNKAEKSGMPYSILKKVYDRGMAAYKTGHRPGATPQQWAFARVNSFVTKSAGTWGKADKDLAKQVEQIEEACWDGYKQVGMKKKGSKEVPNCVPEENELNEWGEITEKDDKSGKELNNPTKGDIKKYKVYVKNAKGNVVKVEFGDPNMEIKRDDPARRKAFRARHNCDQKKDKTTAGYWSCKFWSGKSVTDLMKG